MADTDTTLRDKFLAAFDALTALASAPDAAVCHTSPAGNADAETRHNAPDAEQTNEHPNGQSLCSRYASYEHLPAPDAAPAVRTRTAADRTAHATSDKAGRRAEAAGVFVSATHPMWPGGFDAAWNAYMCARQGHIVEYVAASTSATPPRIWVCKRCGHRSTVRVSS